jgi:hypothetical protein
VPRERESAGRDRSQLLVFIGSKDWTCGECGHEGFARGFFTLADAGPICMRCSDLDHLWFLPSGDSALTRRAKAASSLAPVVLRWSRARHRYERQGLLVEEAALAQAEESCLADAEARQRRQIRDAERRGERDVELVARLAGAIREQFPGCPAERAERIADHAGQRSSGRIGRTQAGRELEPHAVRLAVVASVRHLDTDYDDLLMAGVPREVARDLVRAAVGAVLDRWSRSS